MEIHRGRDRGVGRGGTECWWGRLDGVEGFETPGTGRMGGAAALGQLMAARRQAGVLHLQRHVLRLVRRVLWGGGGGGGRRGEGLGRQRRRADRVPKLGHRITLKPGNLSVLGQSQDARLRLR